MKAEEIGELIKKFEAISSEVQEVECWSARGLQPLLGYQRWENFEMVLEKARISCAQAGEALPNHFRDVTKMVPIGLDSEREVVDIALIRNACYLVAQNGDSWKAENSPLANFKSETGSPYAL